MKVYLIKQVRKGDICAIKVQNIKQHVKKDMTLFLENKRLSGGGIVEDIAFNDDNGTAVVTFEENKGFWKKATM